MPVPSLNRVRLATFLCPPIGLALLWRRRELSLAKKAFGTVGIALYTLVYLALAVGLLMITAGLEVEWRGGFPPVLTFHKTKPDYSAVENHRVRQTNQVASVSEVPANAGVNPYWTDFRGPKRDGHYAEGPILTNWPAGGLRKLWSQPVGGGYASFAIAHGRIFTIEQRREQEAVTAYDLTSGRELWAHTYPAVFSESMGGDGPRATPTFHEGRIYSMGGQGELCCLDATSGKLLWRKNVLDDARATCLYFGMSASPLIVADSVVVLSGDPVPPVKGVPNHTVIAYHKSTGERVWSASTNKMAYASPMLVSLAGQEQLLVLASDRVLGLKPGDGSPLWSFPWAVQYDNNIAQPLLVASNRLVLSAGYGAGSMAIEISADSTGYNARQLWKNQNLKTKFNSAVHWNGFVYGLDEGILTCLDATSGRRQWKDGRYGYGQLLLASGHLVVLSGEGELILVRAVPERLDEVARFQAIQGKTWNHPAIAAGHLLVRNAVEMACFDLSPGAAAQQ